MNELSAPGPAGPLKFGSRILGVGLRHLGEVARSFEEARFESVWIQEHLVFPAEMPPAYPYSEDGYPPITSHTPAYDPWVLLAHIAASTSRGARHLPLCAASVVSETVGSRSAAGTSKSSGRSSPP